MPAATLTATTTQQIKIAPGLKTKLSKALQTYAGLRDQRKAADSAMKKTRGSIEDILGEIGESNLSLNGFKTSLVAPVRTTLSEAKLLALGVDPDIIAKAKVSTPTTPYVKVTCPGEKDDE